MNHDEHHPDLPDGTKRCRNCGQVKPLSDFYARKEAVDGFQNRCKICDNNRPRQNDTRRIKNRARQRAVEDLIKAHPDQFKTLLAEQLILAKQEFAQLSESLGNDGIWLRSGPRPEGQTVRDRVSTIASGADHEHSNL